MGGRQFAGGAGDHASDASVGGEDRGRIRDDVGGVFGMIVRAIYKWLLPVTMRKLEARKMPYRYRIVAGAGLGLEFELWQDDPLDDQAFVADRPSPRLRGIAIPLRMPNKKPA